MNKTIFVLFFIFSLFISPLLSQGKKLIVIVERANIYLDPNQRSSVIETVEKGTLLNLRSPRKVNKIWYYVFVVSKETGMTKAGFILDSLVEMHFEVAKPTIIDKVPTVPKIKVKKPRIAPVSPPKTYVPKKIETIPKSSIRAIVGYAMLSEENYGSGFKYGGSLCLEITKNIAIELSGIRFQSNVEGNPEALSEGKLSIIPIQLSLKARFLMAGRFVPYVLGGGGYYLSSFALDEGIISNWDAFGFDIEEKVENAIGFHFGAGLDLFVTKNIALNADLRYCIANPKGSWTLTDQFAGIETSGSLEDLNLNSFMFGVGLKFYF